MWFWVVLFPSSNCIFRLHREVVTQFTDRKLLNLLCGSSSYSLHFIFLDTVDFNGPLNVDYVDPNMLVQHWN